MSISHIRIMSMVHLYIHFYYDFLLNKTKFKYLCFMKIILKNYLKNENLKK